MSDYDIYLDVIDDVEKRIEDDNEYPVVKDSRMKMLCFLFLNLKKIVFTYILYNVTKKDENKSE